MRTFHIKKGDRFPRLRATLTDRNGKAVDLTAAESVLLHMRRKGTTRILINAAADIIDADTGVVEYAWGAGNTAEAGLFEAEFEVNWADGKETFPNDGQLLVRIAEEIA